MQALGNSKIETAELLVNKRTSQRGTFESKVRTFFVLSTNEQSDIVPGVECVHIQ